MPKKHKHPIDKKYDNIVSFFDQDERHIKLCKKMVGSEYSEINTMEEMRQSIALINDFLTPVINDYKEPVATLLQACEKAKATRYQNILININESLEILEGMLETLPDSPVGKKIKRANFKISNDFRRERDKIHFFDSILLQNAEKLVELKSTVQDYRQDPKKVFKVLVDVQDALRMICLAYDDRWRSMRKLLEFHYGSSRV